MAEYTPMMQHYLDTKEEYKDCILFYRLGDFYEMFFEDAKTASRELEITLTGKDCGQEERAPMCGVPFHAANMYIAKLIEKGYKVAICEQIEDPKKAKGMVKRDVVRVVTPGTLVEDNLLEEKKNNYIMSIYKEGIFFGVAVCDISTGEFLATQIRETNNFTKLLDEIARYYPAEIVTNELLYSSVEEISKIKERIEAYISHQTDDNFDQDTKEIMEKYEITDDKGHKHEDLQGKEFVVSAINGLLKYIKQTQKIEMEHINTIKIYNTTKYMSLDISARRNLELIERMRDKSKRGTLLWVLDKTATSMGGRLLRRWINDPLIDTKEINQRLTAVAELKSDMILKDDVIETLKKIFDIERIAGKISYGNANARDMLSLKSSVKKLPDLRKLLENTKSEQLKEIYQNMDELSDIYELIEKSIIEEPGITITEGNIIKKGYNEEVDKLKSASTEGKNWLINLEAKEKEETGIKNLKISYNKVFGYYIEVTKSNLKLVPERFVRKQTLTNGERYITEELKEIEDAILGSQEKLVDLEYKLYLEIRDKIAKEIPRIQKTAEIVATLDVLSSFANVAEAQNYVMPIVDNSGEINIEEGRHPVIEKMLSAGEFVPNDTYMNKSSDRLRSNNRTKHGRKINLYATSSINYTYGTNWFICPSKIC